jgi:hypothetical protein
MTGTSGRALTAAEDMLLNDWYISSKGRNLSPYLESASLTVAPPEPSRAEILGLLELHYGTDRDILSGLGIAWTDTPLNSLQDPR